jgi:Na+/proline symporter
MLDLHSLKHAHSRRFSKRNKSIAACFLIPMSVCVYVFVGGIRAALFCDYIHTTILLVFILVFMFSAYATSDKIGSPDKMYELLQEAAIRAPVAGNAGGSYLTMRSVNGLIFGVINVSRVPGCDELCFTDVSYIIYAAYRQCRSIRSP